MKRLLILSGKGGTGKTTIASSFIYFSKAKAIADCDVDAPNLHLVSNFQSKPIVSDFIGSEKAMIHPEKCIGCQQCLKHCRFGAIKMEDGHCQVNEYACEGCGVCEYVCPVGAVSMVDDVAGTQYLFKEDQVFSSAKLKMGRGNSGKLVSEVKKALFDNSDADLAIIDGSPGIGCPVSASIIGVDLVLIVAEASKSGISDLRRLLGMTETFHTSVAVCVNKWDASPENTKEIEDFCKGENIPFVGKIPYDSKACKAMNAGISLAQLHTPSVTSLKNVYENTMSLMVENVDEGRKKLKELLDKKKKEIEEKRKGEN